LISFNCLGIYPISLPAGRQVEAGMLASGMKPFRDASAKNRGGGSFPSKADPPQAEEGFIKMI